ncbi:hypothetical protein D9M72_535840 [compost metagenome]
MEHRIGLLAHGGEEAVIGVARALRWRRTVGKLEARAPFRLDRRGGQEQGAVEIAGNAGLRQSFQRRFSRHRIGALDGIGSRDIDEIDGAGNARVQAFRREAGDLVDARYAARKRCPVIFDALAERGDDAHAGDGDDRTTEMILVSVAHQSFLLFGRKDRDAFAA